MVLRILFFALMAMGLLGFGTVAWIATRAPATAQAAAPPPPVKVTVLTAAHALRAGALLKPEDLAAKEILAQDQRPGMSNNTPEARQAMVGAMMRHPLSEGEPLLDAEVLHPGDHGFLSAVLEPGMRAVTVGVDAVTGTIGLIWPGDRVDLILTQSIQDPGLPIGRRVAAETVLSDARVIAIDQQLVQGADAANTSDQHARTVTLEVTEEQAQHVSVAIRLGRLSLSVRSAEPVPGQHNHSHQHATTWAADVSQALSVPQTAPAPSTIRVFQGSGDAKEFKF